MGGDGGKEGELKRGEGRNGRQEGHWRGEECEGEG